MLCIKATQAEPRRGNRLWAVFPVLPSLKEQIHLPSRQEELPAAWKRLLVLCLPSKTALLSRMACKVQSDYNLGVDIIRRGQILLPAVLWAVGEKASEMTAPLVSTVRL